MALRLPRRDDKDRICSPQHVQHVRKDSNKRSSGIDW